jgi:GAF domain-containing protein
LSDDAANSVAALNAYFVGGSTMGETLHRVAELAGAAVPATNFVGITMMVRGKPATTVFTDPDAPEIDQAQYDTGHGPCLDAFRTGKVCAIPSTRRDITWPEFSRACLDHGIHSTLSLPLNAADLTLGATNLYSNEADAFPTAGIDAATAFASQAAIVLANAQAYTDARTLGEDLTKSMAAREIIEQAKGIIMGSLRCTPDEAFEQLVRQSQATNIKLRDVAEQLVKNTSRRR